MGLFEQFDAIAERRIPWRKIPAELGVTGYVCRYEKHYIYWKLLDDGGVGIVTILHEHMHQIEMFGEHLPSEYQHTTFANEADERALLEVRDSSDYIEWSKAQRVVFPKLKPLMQTISLRLPQHLLKPIKATANACDVPHQSLIKIWLHEKV